MISLGKKEFFCFSENKKKEKLGNMFDFISKFFEAKNNILENLNDKRRDNIQATKQCVRVWQNCR